MHLADQQLLKNYFPVLESKQQEQLLSLRDLYHEWNAKINVISRKDIDEIMVRHILHSLAIQKLAPLPENITVLDIGTGGGFPGIPLAILNPTCSFHLVDSIGKKIRVVQEVANAVGLSNVQAEQARVESLTKKYDLIVARAVAQTTQLLVWTKHHFKKKPKYLLLKGGDLKEELKGIKACKEHQLSSIYKEEFFETKKLVSIG